MRTRKAATKVYERSGKYTFKSCNSFPIGVLPTKRNALQMMLHERNWRTPLAAVTVLTELAELWISCTVFGISVDGLVS